MSHPLVEAAGRLTEELLFPDATVVDGAEAVPDDHFDALRDAGLFGIEVAPDLASADRWLITEILASGCMATAFVWIQHHSAVRAVSGTENRALRDRWLAEMLAGRVRAGIAIGGVRPPRPSLRAKRSPQGWSLSGSVPWVTGWGLVQLLLVGAVDDDDREMWALLPAEPAATLIARRHRLIAADASRTVALSFDRHPVGQDSVIGFEPRRTSPAGDGGVRSNSSLALGVVRRSCALMGPSVVDRRLDSVRSRLDSASDPELAAARAAAAELAFTATARLTVHTGSRAVDVDGHAQRLAREAHFAAVFGTRPAIKAHLLQRLDDR